MKKQGKSIVRKKRTAPKPAAREARDVGARALMAVRSAYGYLLAIVRPFRVPSRRLRSMETLSLPNKQTVSLVQVDGQEFLIGGTANSVVLLARLEMPAPRRKTRSKQMTPVSVVPVPAPAKVEPLVASFAAKVQ
jgi:hypothetical protein